MFSTFATNLCPASDAVLALSWHCSNPFGGIAPELHDLLIAQQTMKTKVSNSTFFWVLWQANAANSHIADPACMMMPSFQCGILKS